MISKEELIEKIEDLDVSDAELAQYILIDENSSEPFNIAYKVNPNTVLNLSTADEGMLGFLNKRARRKRRRKYERKIRKGFNGIRIVSEGDSWFQYPVFLKDIIDNIDENNAFAVYSLGYGGDWLANIYVEKEYLYAIRDKQPSVFLMSGGGNDLAGKNRLATMVHSYDTSLSPEEYLNKESEKFLEEIKELYKKIFDNLTSEFPNLKIICHGYDYVIPNKGRWLGEPLKTRGINDSDLQKEILRIFIDRFNEMQQRVIANYSNVSHVDLRGTIDQTSGWKDELHPTNHYFKKIAVKIEKGIMQALNLT